MAQAPAAVHGRQVQAPARNRGDAGRAPGSDQDPRGEEGRTQRTMRFTTVIDRKLRELAEARGIDLNAAVCVAVAEDWQRTLSSDDGTARRYGSHST